MFHLFLFGAKHKGVVLFIKNYCEILIMFWTEYDRVHKNNKLSLINVILELWNSRILECFLEGYLCKQHSFYEQTNLHKKQNLEKGHYMRLSDRIKFENFPKQYLASVKKSVDRKYYKNLSQQFVNDYQAIIQKK